MKLCRIQVAGIISVSYTHLDVYKRQVYNKCLLCLENMIFSMLNQSLQDFGLPPPTQDTNIITVNREYLKELSCNTVQLSDMVAENFPKLNADQKLSLIHI